MSVLSTVALVASLASSVAAHGYVQGYVVGGTYYEGYNPSMQYQSPPPDVIGWSDPADLGNGFIAPDAYATSDIICHLNATNAPISATVAAGDKIEFQWTAWPSSHHGPVITYLANCNGDCSTVDKTTLEFVKIDEGGLISDTSVPGTWATDTLIANNNSWTSTIPSTIAAGNYVVRHEIIALHSAGTADGAQNYPQCANLKITGTGSEKPTGTLGEALYKESDAGVIINIYQSLSTYDIPGPTLWSGAATGAQSTAAATSTAAASSAASSSAAAATTSAASSSAAATTAAAVVSTTSSSVATSAAATSAATTSAAVLTSAAAYSVQTDTATDVVTAQVYTTVTGSAPAASSAAASSAASSVVAPLASAASALPSGALTSTISTTLPTATGSSGNSTGLPSKPLPAGTTLADLLEWVQYLFSEYYSKSGSSKAANKSRAHARDVLVARK
ncbi:hypothetical protein MBLNU459_g5196t1 [Dothideomycetes sp. NU459]